MYLTLKVQVWACRVTMTTHLMSTISHVMSVTFFKGHFFACKWCFNSLQCLAVCEEPRVIRGLSVLILWATITETIKSGETIDSEQIANFPWLTEQFNFPQIIHSKIWMEKKNQLMKSTQFMLISILHIFKTEKIRNAELGQVEWRQNQIHASGQFLSADEITYERINYITLTNLRIHLGKTTYPFNSILTMLHSILTILQKSSISPVIECSIWSKHGQLDTIKKFRRNWMGIERKTFHLLQTKLDQERIVVINWSVLVPSCPGQYFCPTKM